MSMPVTLYYCNRCDYETPSSKIWGNFAYIVDEQEVLLNRGWGWCHSCSSLEPVELFTDQKEIINSLSSTLFRLALHKESPLKRIVFAIAPSKSSIQASILECQKLQVRLRLIVDRQSNERCLTCGANDIIFVDKYLARKNNNSISTGFSHPHCGGLICKVEDNLRFAKNIERFRFDALGNALHQ